MLSPVERAAWDRGQGLKRCVRAAAALNALYFDSDLADAAEIGRGAVGAWWDGAKPSPEHIFAIASVTGLSADELTRYIYADGSRVEFRWHPMHGGRFKAIPPVKI